MANTFEYIIKLRDQMSAGMEKLSGASHKALAATDKAIDKVTKASRTAGQSLKKITTPRRIIIRTNAIRMANKLVNKLGNSLDKVKNKLSGVGGKIAGWRKDFVKDLPGSHLLSNPLTLAGGAIAGMWAATQKAMKAGMQKMQLQVLTGKQVGAKLFQGLTKFATDTVFGSEVYGQATQMLANGINSSKILPYMKMLGDISMGDKNKLGQLSLAFAQVKAKGHLAGQELLQLINAGFNPLQTISRITGKGMDTLTKMMAKGKITFDMVRQSLKAATGPGGKFNNMLQKIASTPYGQLQNLQGQLEQMMIKIGNVFLPIASKFMQFISWIGEKMGPFLEPAVAILGGLAAGILALTAAQWLWNAAQLANPLTWIIGLIVGLIALIGYLIVKIDGWGSAWKHTVNGAKLIWKAFTFSAKNGWDTMVNLIMIGLNKIKEGWYKFKNVVGLGDKSANNKMLAQINADTESRKKAIVDGARKQAELVMRSANEFKKAFNSFSWDSKTSLGNVKNKITSKLGLPGVPGGVAAAGSGSPTASAKKTNTAIATGGTRNTTVHISIGNLVKEFKLTTGNLKETKEQIIDVVTDAMTRAVGMGASLGS